MRSELAARYAEQVSYKSGWRINAYADDDFTMLLTLSALVEDSSKYDAPRYGNPIVAGHTKEVNTRAMDTEEDVYSAVLDFIIEQEIHEAREFFKVGYAYHPPFHPHTEEGRKNYESRTHNFNIH